MAEIKGDATQEDIEKQVLKDLRAKIASSGASVTLTGAEATQLLQMAGGSMEAEDEEDQQVAPKTYAEYAERTYPEVKDEEPAPGAPGAPATQSAAKPHSAPAQASAKPSRAQLNEMTKEQLIEYADDHDIEVMHSWSKGDIVDAIAKHK